MSFMNWDDDLHLKIEGLDAEHKKLLGLINAFYDAVQMGKSESVMGGILDELIAYTVTHFSREEDYMRVTHYPSFEDHKREHDVIRRQLMAFHTKASCEITPALAQELLIFLKCWLFVHIYSCDRAYAPHLRAHGIV